MDSIDLLRYFVALTLVLALGGVALLFKRYAANPVLFRTGVKAKWSLKTIGKWDFTAPEKRLAVVETLMLGPRQRLLIVRRDDIEHLVLSGPDGTTVLESGIPAKTSDRAAP